MSNNWPFKTNKWHIRKCYSRFIWRIAPAASVYINNSWLKEMENFLGKLNTIFCWLVDFISVEMKMKWWMEWNGTNEILISCEWIFGQHKFWAFKSHFMTYFIIPFDPNISDPNSLIDCIDKVVKAKIFDDNAKQTSRNF